MIPEIILGMVLMAFFYMLNLPFGMLKMCIRDSIYMVALSFATPSRGFGVTWKFTLDKMCIRDSLNALTVDMALGCSTNSMLHLPAIAHEIGMDFDISFANEISAKTPNQMCIRDSL